MISMYKVIFTQGYTTFEFEFKEFIDASCFMKQALENRTTDFSIRVDYEPEGICAKDGEE